MLTSRKSERENMDTKTHHPSCSLLTFFISTVVVGIIVISVLMLLPVPKHRPSESKAQLERIRSDVSVAETKWKSHGITDFDIEAVATVHPSACWDLSKEFMAPLHFKIRQGELALENEIQKNANDECHFDALLPPKAFDTIRKIITDEIDPEYEYLEIEFDPEYGFVTLYRLTANNSYSDLNVVYIFSNFQPLQP